MWSEITFPNGKLVKSTCDNRDLVVGVTETGYFRSITREFNNDENLRNDAAKLSIFARRKKYYSKLKESDTRSTKFLFAKNNFCSRKYQIRFKNIFQYPFRFSTQNLKNV
jgi:hypothetical protein